MIGLLKGVRKNFLITKIMRYKMKVFKIHTNKGIFIVAGHTVTTSGGCVKIIQTESRLREGGLASEMIYKDRVVFLASLQSEPVVVLENGG